MPWFEILIEKIGPRQIVMLAISLILLCLAALATISYSMSKDLCIDFGSLKISNCKKPPTSEKSLLEKIKSGREFNIAFSVKNNQESNCLTIENSSPIGDFLVGAVYNVKYNTRDNLFFTTGLNHGVAGCPFTDNSDARLGSNLEQKEMILWGRKFTFTKSGKVYSGGNHVGFLFFPAN